MLVVMFVLIMVDVVTMLDYWHLSSANTALGLHTR